MSGCVDLSSVLSVDYEKLYESGRYADISIHVGKEPNSKIFLAHTLVLCTRSTFLEKNLTGNTDTTEAVQKATVAFEDMAPDVFEILLRYIYTGKMSYELCKNIGWIDILDGARKFELVDLLAAIETYLIDKEDEWIQQNILTTHKYATSTASLNKLLAYCNRMMVSHPDIILKSNGLVTLPKETLITLLKSDELCMDEDDIWMSVIEWAIKQVPERELETDTDDWSSNDINTVKDIIVDCIPYIRFFSIPLNKVALYYDLLPKKLVRDILNYHSNKDCRPNTCMLPPRRGLDSSIINKQQAVWILSKIAEATKRPQKSQETSMENINNKVYKFTLLYRQSRDGNQFAKLKELCYNKGPTVAIGKVSGTEEILGGYNPLAWRCQSCYRSTTESFIFALNNNISESIASFVDNNSYAINEYNYWFFGFGNDLFFGSYDNYTHKPYAIQAFYQLPIRSSSDSFDWIDWEVFLVSNVETT